MRICGHGTWRHGIWGHGKMRTLGHDMGHRDMRALGHDGLVYVNINIWLMLSYETISSSEIYLNRIISNVLILLAAKIQ